MVRVPPPRLLRAPDANSVHLCLDMQRIFGRGGIWETPWMEKVLPNIVRIATKTAEMTVFTRFVTPRTPDEAEGSWKAYYEKWNAATRAELPADQLRLMPQLEELCPPALVIEKPGYSAFFETDLRDMLKERGAQHLIVTGSVTDVCVLSSVLSAIDEGFFVTLIGDAVCSSSDEGHDNLMSIYTRRYSSQLQVMTTAELIAVI